MTRKSFAVAIACLITFFVLSYGAKAQDNDPDIETGLESPHRPIVRLIYFLPRDREPQPDIDEKMDRLIKDSQQLYADQMEAHGFGRKTFLFETDVQGKAVVHQFVGKFTDDHYSSLPSTWDVWEEIDKRFDTSKNIYVTMIDMSSKFLDTSGVHCDGCPSIAGQGGRSGPTGGKSLFTDSISIDHVIHHELGHAFGLFHDIRNNAKRIPRFTTDRMLNSFCAAEWLDMHPAFNPGNPLVNQNTTVKLLPPSLASPPNVIRLRFEVTDPDGIHQAQLFTPALLWDDDLLLRDYERLDGNLNTSVEFATRIAPKDESVYLNVIDVHGNITWMSFSIEITPLLSSPTIVSIPDKNLAAAVQEVIGNSVTTHTMLNLVKLDVRGHQITDLTGLEHAHNLKSLFLTGNAISDFSPLAGLPQLILVLNDSSISDISPLAGLTQLTELQLNNNSISDISPLAGLTQLKSLGLDDNSILDVSPLAGLTQLTELWLHNNSILDVSPLAGLTQLTVLGLNNNAVSDVSSLSGLTQLTILELSGGSISDISPLAGLTQLRFLGLNNNSASDISPLVGLTRLRFLELYGNSILDVSPLVGLTQLTELWLGNNSISDVSPLSGLTRLTVLGLYDNAVSDVSPLLGLNLTGTKGISLWGASHAIVADSTGLYLEGNPLSHASINTHIPAMQAKGIEVRFDIPPALLKGGPKIEGPWLWVLLSGAQFDTFHSTDLLAQVSGGKVTELNIATDGAAEGASVGDSVWTPHKISSTGGNNINDLLNALSISKGNVNENVVYGSIILDSPHEQETKMFAGSDDNHKVWLNGKLVNEQLNWNWATDYQESFPVTLKRGKNVLLVAVHDGGGGWCGFFGFAPDTEYTVRAPGSGDTYSEFPDVNSDGVINIQDLVLVASRLGQTGQNKADVNGDNVINILDLVLVAGALGKSAAAPALHRQASEVFTSADVRRWLSEAQDLNLPAVTAQRGISFLQQLLAALLPKETALLANYPNPFNPETWIPYQLSEPAAVRVTIYAVNGSVVRMLVLGHQSAGIYKNQRRAAYWDGKNQQGEVVASGIYFYTLSAGDFRATRKMLIQK